MWGGISDLEIWVWPCKSFAMWTRRPMDTISKFTASGPADRVQSRIAVARSSNRQSQPLTNPMSSPQSNNTTPNASRIPSSIETKSSTPYSRRFSHLPSPSGTSRTQREQSPLSPASALDTPRSRLLGISPQTSFSSPKLKEGDSSPQLLAQLSRRRGSYTESVQTPPNRNHLYRPSNLHYSSSRDNEETPHVDTPDASVHHSFSRGDGTESLDSTGAPASVWDELDDLKTRIRRIELSGKMPATAAAAVSNGSGERPRTANTSITTASTSPQQYRKPTESPAESTVGPLTSNKFHPLLHSALAKAKEHTAPAVYRSLEAVASEALELAEMTGSAGPQGTLFSASSIITGASVPDRQVRRKADNLCRSLTELCLALTDVKPSMASPAFRSTVAAGSRRASIPLNGDSPSVRASVEPETNGVPRSSPSRAMSRIEARRSSVLGLNGSAREAREASQEPLPPSQSRLNRAGTSLYRSRHPADEEEDDDPTLRAPSRAMTDFQNVRNTRATAATNRLSRDYNTNREPPIPPELQPSPSLQAHHASLRHPSISEASLNHQSQSSNTLLFREPSSRRYVERQNSPALEKALGNGHQELGPRTQAFAQYTSSLRQPGGGAAAVAGVGRTASLRRPGRGAGVGD